MDLDFALVEVLVDPSGTGAVGRLVSIVLRLSGEGTDCVVCEGRGKGDGVVICEGTANVLGMVIFLLNLTCR
jgi:hypothetical protein